MKWVSQENLVWKMDLIKFYDPVVGKECTLGNVKIEIMILAIFILILTIL
jgi:hypothetical protein